MDFAWRGLPGCHVFSSAAWTMIPTKKDDWGHSFCWYVRCYDRCPCFLASPFHPCFNWFYWCLNHVTAHWQTNQFYVTRTISEVLSPSLTVHCYRRYHPLLEIERFPKEQPKLSSTYQNTSPINANHIGITCITWPTQASARITLLSRQEWAHHGDVRGLQRRSSDPSALWDLQVLAAAPAGREGELALECHGNIWKPWPMGPMNDDSWMMIWMMMYQKWWVSVAIGVLLEAIELYGEVISSWLRFE